MGETGAMAQNVEDPPGNGAAVARPGVAPRPEEIAQEAVHRLLRLFQPGEYVDGGLETGGGGHGFNVQDLR